MDNGMTVHEHEEFQKSYNPKKYKKQKDQVEKIKKFLKSDCGMAWAERLKGDASPFRSFPRGHHPIRCLFMLCQECQKQAIIPNCEFCGSDEHTMQDAVLFYIAEHDKAYKKEGKRIIKQYLSEYKKQKGKD